MTRKTSADFAPEVLQHFDAYVHGALSRRGEFENGLLGFIAVQLLEE